MKTFTRVYVAKVKLYQTYEDGRYENECYNRICYTLEDALKSIFNCVRGDLIHHQKISKNDFDLSWRQGYH